MDSATTAELSERLSCWRHDYNRSVIVGHSGLPEKTEEGDRAIVFVGSDVSGHLHIGHLYNLVIAAGISHLLRARLMISLNEAETVLSRAMPIDDALRNRERIVQLLGDHNVEVHSRVGDERLVLQALSIFSALTDETYSSLITALYGGTMTAEDVMSVSFMAAVPMALARKANATNVIAIYGEDELPHLMLMSAIYASERFKEIMLLRCGEHPPRFGFAVTRLVPGNSPKQKMSKSLPDAVIAFDGTAGTMRWRDDLSVQLDRARRFAREVCALSSTDPLMQTLNRVLSKGGWAYE